MLRDVALHQVGRLALIPGQQPLVIVVFGRERWPVGHQGSQEPEAGDVLAEDDKADRQWCGEQEPQRAPQPGPECN